MLSPQNEAPAVLVFSESIFSGFLCKQKLSNGLFVYMEYISYIRRMNQEPLRIHMETAIHNTQNKRKLIDLKPKTFRSLSIMAASNGISLKRFIENRLDEIAESKEDAVLYDFLCKTDPDGLKMVSDKEQIEFEKKQESELKRLDSEID